MRNSGNTKLVDLLTALVNGFNCDSDGANFENIIAYNLVVLSHIYDGEIVTLQEYFNADKEIDPVFKNNNSKNIPKFSSNLEFDDKIVISKSKRQSSICFYPAHKNLAYYWNKKNSKDNNTPNKHEDRLFKWIEESKSFQSNIIFSKNQIHSDMDLLASFDRPNSDSKYVFWIQVKNKEGSSKHSTEVSGLKLTK